MQKLLIVRLSALGDIIHSAVVLEFIKRDLPHLQIDWLVENGFKDILENSPYLNRVETISLKSLKKEKSFANLKKIYLKLRELSQNNYDLIIDMQGLIKSAIASRIIGKNIHGYSFQSAKEGIGTLLYKSKTFSDYSENKILRNMKLVNDALNLKISKEDILRKKPHLFYKDENLFSANGKIVFVVGSSMPQKNYPKENFLKLAKILNSEIFVIWGDENELEIGKWLSQNCEKIFLAPKMNLNQLKYFVSTASVLIGNDTGPTYIAWAMNIPSITIFGLTPTEQALITDINLVVKSPTKVNHRKIDKSDFSIADIPPIDIYREVKIISQLNILMKN
jgi:heptosyltransferase-1